MTVAIATIASKLSVIMLRFYNRSTCDRKAQIISILDWRYIVHLYYKPIMNVPLEQIEIKHLCVDRDNCLATIVWDGYLDLCTIRVDLDEILEDN